MEKKSMSTDEAPKYIQDTIDKLDAQKVEGIDRAMQLQLIDHVQMQVELKRLIKKYGAKHARVKKLAFSLIGNKQLVSTFALQKKFSSAQTEDFNPDTWRIQGFVYSSDALPLDNLEVSVVSQSVGAGKLSGQTDEKGFYSITVEKNVLVKLVDLNREEKGGEKEKEEQKEEQKRGERFFLQVHDKARKLIHTENKALTPVIGVIDVENISIPEKQKPRDRKEDILK